MPIVAVLVSGAGMVPAMVLSKFFPDSLFVSMIAVSTFGALFAWLMTLVTHLAFRRHHHRQARPYLRFGPAGPWASLAGLLAVLAVMLSTWWVPGFRIMLGRRGRSEEHTSELQSRGHLVCRLLLEKKKNNKKNSHYAHEYYHIIDQQRD